MFDVCPNCGEYHPEKEVDPAGPYLVCQECGHKQRFIQLPLFIVTGASGTGKSAVCLELMSKTKDVVILESDILWRKEFDQPENEYREYRELWLNLSANISQSGRPVALFGSASPEQFEQCAGRRYFSDVHYLALICEDGVLTERLRGRPKWRNSSTEEFIKKHTKWNSWLRDNAKSTEPSMVVLDTTKISIEDAADKVAEWIRLRINRT